MDGDVTGDAVVDPLLDALAEDIDRLAVEASWRCDDDTLVARLDRLPVLAERLRGIHLQAISQIAGRGTVEREQGWSIADRLATTLHQPMSQARATTMLAHDLNHVDGASHEGGDGLSDAIKAGRSSVEQAKAICAVLKELPDDATHEQRGQIRDALTEQCRTLEPRALRELGNDLIERLFPEQVDAKLADQLEREEKRAQRRRFLDLPGRVTGGTVDFHGRLPFLQFDRFRRLVDAYLESDRKAGTRQAADALLDPDEQPRPSKAQRRADALCHMLDDLDARACAPEAGGDRPVSMIQIDYDQLLSGLRGAQLLGTDQTVDPGTARRMACAGNILPVVLGGDSVPLDVGRMQRLFTGGVRRAVIVRDGGCAFPGCDVPPERCEIHHVVPWWLGGETSRDNGVLLCVHHHHLLEPNPRVDQATRWTVRLDGGGLPEVVPPYRVDPLRRPRQHHRYRFLRAHQPRLPDPVGAGPP